jgi:hypothetical protein
LLELHSHSLASALAPLRDWEITVARTFLFENERVVSFDDDESVS